jgi:hypothetical protein
MKPVKTAARTIALCAPVALFPLLYAAGAPAKVSGDHGQSPGWVDGFGAGTITGEVQPGTSNPCDSTHQCQITISGTGTIQPGEPGGGSWNGGHHHGNFALQAVITVDVPDGTTNGFGGNCYPVTGSLSLSPSGGGTGTLVVGVQGQDCAVGSSTTLSAIAATYVVDGNQSTGKFGGAAGVGTIAASLDASRSPLAVGFAFSGSLSGWGNHGDGGGERSSR